MHNGKAASTSSESHRLPACLLSLIVHWVRAPTKTARFAASCSAALRIGKAPRLRERSLRCIEPIWRRSTDFHPIAFNCVQQEPCSRIPTAVACAASLFDATFVLTPRSDPRAVISDARRVSSVQRATLCATAYISNHTQGLSSFAIYRTGPPHKPNLTLTTRSRRSRNTIV
jgi:hypothetical protein